MRYRSPLCLVDAFVELVGAGTCLGVESRAKIRELVVLLDLFALDGVLRSKLLVQVVDLLGDLLVLGLPFTVSSLSETRARCSVRKLAVELLTRFRELRVQLGAQVTECLELVSMS